MIKNPEFYELRQVRREPFDTELIDIFQTYSQAVKAQDALLDDLPKSCFRIDRVTRAMVSICGDIP